MGNKKSAPKQHIYLGLFHWTAGIAIMALLVINHESFLDGTFFNYIF